MARTKLVTACAFLVLILFLEIQFAEGRVLKPNDQKSRKLHGNGANHASDQSPHKGLIGSTNPTNFASKPPTRNPRAAHSSLPTSQILNERPKLDASITPSPGSSTASSVTPTKNQIPDASPTVPTYPDGSQPTTPGHRPSLGNYFLASHGHVLGDNFPSTQKGLKPKTPAHSPGTAQSVSAPKAHVLDDDLPSTPHGFRPTTPGHSPGIGHPVSAAQIHDLDDPINTPDGFRPTTPGHSPGIGHSLSSSQVRSLDGSSRAPIGFMSTTPAHTPGVGHPLSPSRVQASGDDFGAPYRYSTTPGHSPGMGHSFSPTQNRAFESSPKPNGYRTTTTSHD